MKPIYLALIALALIGVVSFLLMPKTYAVPQQELDTQTSGEEPATSSATEGVVTKVNTDQAAFDGPVLITIKTASGEERVVAVPSMGFMLCVAKDQIADPYTLAVGARVSVKGNQDEESGYIVPCESADHYLRVASKAN